MGTAIYAMTDPDTHISECDALVIAGILTSQTMTYRDLTGVRHHLTQKPQNDDFDEWNEWHLQLTENRGWSYLADMLWSEQMILRLTTNRPTAVHYIHHAMPDAEYTTNKLAIYSILHIVFGDCAYQLLPYIGFIYWN